MERAMSDPKYGAWDDEAAAQDAKAKDSSGSQFLPALAEGDTELRFLPPKPGKRSPLAVAYVHWVTRADQTRTKVNCPRMMSRLIRERGGEVPEGVGGCPLCEKADKLRASKSNADQLAAKKLWPKLSVYANVIDRANENAGPQVYGFGKSVHEQLLAIRANPRKGGQFVDPEKGRDLIVARKGKGQMDTEYSVSAALDASPLHADPGVADEWLEAAADLDQFLKVPTPDEIRQQVMGGDAPPERSAGRGSATQYRAPARTVADDLGADDLPF